MWREQVARRVVAEIVMANGGSRPSTIWQWRAVMKRFGVRKWRIVSPCLCPWPYIRRHVLYLPHVRGDNIQLLRFLVHETAEAVLGSEGTEPFCYSPTGTNVNHEISCKVEEIWLLGDFDN